MNNEQCSTKVDLSTCSDELLRSYIVCHIVFYCNAQEHTDAEKAWVEKLASVEKEYEAYEQDMKEEIEGKLTDLIKRLTDIAKREAKREGRRTELIKQVT